jgi:hypothetical protein
MDRRDSDYSRVRIIVERGIDGDSGDSCAHGEDRRLSPRIANRGSGRVGADPWDTFDIKRIRRRVRDLKLQQEIQRLKQWLRDLKASSTWKETEPVGTMGDESTGG